MKKVLIFFAVSLFLMAGCTGNRQSVDGLITVDVTEKYPKKELILQDFMDVEYIPLETSDEFITQGLLQDVGRDVIIVRNNIDDGNIFIFDRHTGKALKKINRKGQGGEEYIGSPFVTLDEERGELFVNDHMAYKILVYDLEGNYRRTLKHREGVMYGNAYSFDSDNLICDDALSDNLINPSGNNEKSFFIVSKLDGSITKEIKIPVKEAKSALIRTKDEKSGMTYAYGPSTHHPIVPCLGSWALVELSSDTVYRYSPDHRMEPIITRTPSIYSMNPEVFLFLSLFTERYCFMEAVKKEMPDFPGRDLLYDRQEKAIFRYIVYNGDYVNREKAYLKSTPVNSIIPARQYLDADRLVEAYRENRLKGRLKEIAATLNEDSNPVIMLIKHKIN